jgi:hypothetical protein
VIEVSTEELAHEMQCSKGALPMQILMGGKMSKLLGCLSIAVLALALGAFVPDARATQLDFGCNSSTCTGNVTVSGSNYSSSGIGLINTDATAPPSYSGSAWTLTFDTSSKVISLVNGSLGTLSGIIDGVFTSHNGGSSATLSLTVLWNSLPSAVVTFFGGIPSASDVTSILYIGSTSTGGPVNSSGITMFPTPEPASLILLGSGLLALGASLRKKLVGSSGQV